MFQLKGDTYHTYTNDIIIPVIASFDTEGQVRPLYVRIDGESYKVCSYHEKPSFSTMLSFQCKIADHDRYKMLMLTYHKQENIWMMEKWRGY